MLYIRQFHDVLHNRLYRKIFDQPRELKLPDQPYLLGTSDRKYIPLSSFMVGSADNCYAMVVNIVGVNVLLNNPPIEKIDRPQVPL